MEKPMKKMTAMQFLSEGKNVKTEELGQYAWLAFGYAPEKDVAYAFESREAFMKWSMGTEFEAKVSRIFQIMDDALQYEKADNTYAMERQRKLTERITCELRELSERTGLKIGSKELLLKASAKSHVLEGRIFDSAILFEHWQTGRWLPIVSSWAYPDFRWFNFNDITSSACVFGNLVLCEDIWFRGQGISLSSDILTPQCWDFSGFWDDRVSSGFSLFF